MALATKCPHCNTIFRVALDQLKLRGGIVRCGACNEVFDGNAALVEPAPKQPVIIDLPAQQHAAPTTSPELEALIATLDTRAAEAPEDAFDLDLGVDAEHAPDGIADAGIVAEAEDVADADAAPAAPRPLPWEAAHTPLAGLPTEPPAHLDGGADDGISLDIDIEAYEAAAGAKAGAGQLSAPGSEDDASPADNGRQEPTLDFPDEAETAAALPDEALREEPLPEELRQEAPLPDDVLPDEHLTAVALHDSYELDAYPHDSGDAPEDDAPAAAPDSDTGTDTTEASGHDADEDELDVVTLSGAAPSSSPALPVSASLAGDADAVANAGADADADAAAEAEIEAEAVDEPGFVKRTRRRERAGRVARIVMGAAIPLLLLALGAQVVGTFRNPLAAAVPVLKPALVAVCAVAGCKVELPAQIDALSIEQGELQTLAENVFSFSTTLRNQSGSAQAWPHIELILNDAADKPVLRRVFAPRDYLADAADVDKGFLPRSEQSVKLYFALAQVKASGYHIAIFYP
jgi:predicted Zn finger-like uncharacterized protein